MGVTIGDEDVVKIESGKREGDPCKISVSCPDKTGLGSDLCRILLDFGLSITKGDVSTDGKWCYVVFWVIPRSESMIVRWANVKNRLLSVCPSCSASFYYLPEPNPSPVYLMKVFGLDRRGLLHDVTRVLSELELIIHRVKISTTPDGQVLDLFFITDSMDLLQTEKRQNEIFERLSAIMGESCISCEFQLVGSEYEIIQQISSLPLDAEELFSLELSDDQNHSQALTPDFSKLKKTSISMDNSLSPGHTLLQIQCVDQKGLLYDIMRTLKDCSIQIAYGRFLSNTNGFCEVELFIQQMDGKKIGKKIVDPEKQMALSSRLRMEMLHPLQVMIVDRGPDAELLVSNPVELSGKGRPRVFYDVTLALKLLRICIFSAEIGRHSTLERQWEVYRFLLDETSGVSSSNTRARAQIVDRVRRTLMGW